MPQAILCTDSSATTSQDSTAGLDDKGQTLIFGADGEKKLASACTVDDIVYLGTAVPKTDMALTNNFSYKNWNLSFMFIAKLGHKYRKDVFQGSNRRQATRQRKSIRCLSRGTWTCSTSRSATST